MLKNLISVLAVAILAASATLLAHRKQLAKYGAVLECRNGNPLAQFLRRERNATAR